MVCVWEIKCWRVKTLPEILFYHYLIIRYISLQYYLNRNISVRNFLSGQKSPNRCNPDKSGRMATLLKTDDREMYTLNTSFCYLCSVINLEFVTVGRGTNNDMQPSTSNRIFDEKTPHSEKHGGCPSRTKKSSLSEMGDIWYPTKSRNSPLPNLSWANSKEVWQSMVYKEEATAHNRNSRLFEVPASILPRMRSILVDWIMEVCEAYHLRRVTFYLALDYIDRYLTINPAVPNKYLQLIGISSLFIAAKLEEIYPPKLSEFSYLCDGACSEEDILDCEILLLSSLSWDLNFMTPTVWLNLYMQINVVCNNSENQDPNIEFNFFFPQYSRFSFVKASQLIDLFTLDPGFLLFRYSIIAAAAMYFTFGKAVALQVSGLQWEDLKDCADYMAVYHAVLGNMDDPRLHTVMSNETDESETATYEALKSSVPNLTPSEGYTMQTHIINMQHLEQATLLRLQRMGLIVEKTYELPRTHDSDEDSDDNFSMFEEEEGNTGADEDKPGDDEEGNSSISEEKSKGAREEELKDTNAECTSDTDEPTIPEQESDERGNELKSAMLMFQISKSENSQQVATDIPTRSDLKFFTSKNKYTFDEILIGIHKCTNKQLLLQSSSCTMYTRRRP